MHFFIYILGSLWYNNLAMKPYYDTIVARYNELFNSTAPLSTTEEAEFRDICTTMLSILLASNKNR